MPVKTNKWRYIGIGSGILALLLAGLLLLLLLPGEEPATGPEIPETLPDTTHSLEANPFSPDDFGYDGDYLTCLTGESVLGIDVSSHQKQIDWQQVKAAGVEFVMIRAAYRGYGNGAVLEDELVISHYEGATAAGLKVGFYFFSQAVSPREAAAEAEFLLDVIDGWQVDMPIVFDWEYISPTARTAAVSPRMLTDCAIVFCERIRSAGYEPMVYFNANQSRRDMYLAELTDYKFWLAMYSDEMTYEYRVDMWQYTQTGQIPGIDGDVDINLYFPPN